MRDDVLQQAAERFTHAEVSRRLLEVQVHLEMLKARLIRGENELSKSLSLSASASPSKNSKYSSSPSSVLTETSIELAEIRQHILVDCANHAIVLRRCAPTPGRYSNKRAVRKFARWDRKVEVFVQELRMKHKYLVKLSKRRKEKKKEKIKRRQDGVQREIWPASKKAAPRNSNNNNNATVRHGNINGNGNSNTIKTLQKKKKEFLPKTKVRPEVQRRVDAIYKSARAGNRRVVYVLYKAE